MPHILLLSLLFFFESGCKKKASDAAPAPPTAPPTSAAAATHPCQVDLASLVVSPLPPVYAPVLTTSTPQLSEVAYGPTYKTLLIQFSNEQNLSTKENRRHG